LPSAILDGDLTYAVNPFDVPRLEHLHNFRALTDAELAGAAVVGPNVSV